MRTINQAMDDNDFQTIQEIKNNSGLSWSVFLLESAKAYEKLNNGSD